MKIEDLNKYFVNVKECYSMTEKIHLAESQYLQELKI